MRLAARQHGLVTYAQLRKDGLSERQILHRVSRGVLVRLCRGVYRAGSVAAAWEAEMATLLACGPAAVLSDATAGAIWRLTPDRTTPSVIHVSVPGGYPGRGIAALVHRRMLLPCDIALHEGLRITTPARTILDLAIHLTDRELEQAVGIALRSRATSGDELRRLIECHRHVCGVAALRAVLGLTEGMDATDSELEAGFLRLISKAELPRPRINVMVHGFRVDFYWPAYRLVVEVDGFAFHSSRGSFESDRRRDAVLAAAGIVVLRFTWRQVSRTPVAVAVRIGQVLAREGATAGR